MIPISTFNLLVVVDILFIVYSVIDHDNRLYANITTAMLSAILAVFIGELSVGNIVYESVGASVIMMNSPSMQAFMRLIGVVMFVYTMFMVYRVIDIALEDQKAKKEWEQENRI